MMLGKRYTQIEIGGGVYPSEHIIRFVARNYYAVQNRKDIKILDFGCGAGAHTWFLAREGFDTYAFDISKTVVERLKAQLLKENLNAHVEVLDGNDFHYKDFFDAVIDNVSIMTNLMKDIILMYKNVYSALKQGGKFITVVFGKETTGYKTGTKVEDGTYENITQGPLQRLGYRHFFDNDELMQTLSSIGYKNIKIDFMKYTDNGNNVQQIMAIGEK